MKNWKKDSVISKENNTIQVHPLKYMAIKEILIITYFNNSIINVQKLVKNISKIIFIKGLTLESIYRAADVQCEGRISCADFQIFLEKMRLGLTLP